jgi:hypothetical protein
MFQLNPSRGNRTGEGAAQIAGRQAPNARTTAAQHTRNQRSTDHNRPREYILSSAHIL